jgi:hypothetical protein
MGSAWGTGHLFAVSIQGCLVCLWAFLLTDPGRKHLLVVDVALNPCHQLLDVSRRGHLGRLLVVLRILPQVLKPDLVSAVHHAHDAEYILICRLHLGARLGRAELGNGAVEQVDLVVEIHHFTNVSCMQREAILGIIYSSQPTTHFHLRLLEA